MIAFNCPKCGKAFSVKDEFAGRTTKCPILKCGTPLVVPMVASAPAPAPMVGVPHAPRAAVETTSGTTMKCPSCAEQIQEEAKKCRFCGLILTEAAKSPYADIRQDELDYLRACLASNPPLDFLEQRAEERIARWEAAAKQGVVAAQNLYGMCLYYGCPMSLGNANEKEAVTWFLRAAEQGYADAQFNLGMSYHTGNGVAKDVEKYTAWIRKAAERGYAPAQDTLSLIYFHGNGVIQRDDTQSIAWIRKAAEQGYVPAQLELAGMYECGDRRVTKNRTQAIHWFKKAASQGNEEAKIGLERLIG